MDIQYVLKNFPLRIAITDYCNLQCFFCSNEGMHLRQKNTTHIDFNSLKFLISTLSKNGLEGLSLTGGEPILYPKLEEFFFFLESETLKNKFLHTNGVALNEDIISNGLKNFTKIAVSIHTTGRKTWQKITGGTDSQFKKLQTNLKFLGKIKKGGPQIEIKHVIIQGYNDDLDIIKGTLDLCNGYGFKFKFLNFEPIKKEHQNLVVPFGGLKKKLENLGCKPLKKENTFRGQSDYLPVIWYKYKNTKGVAIEIGCGSPNVCKACFNSNEIFITSNLEIKPCHMSSQMIPLDQIIKSQDENAIYEAVIRSREILRSMPGMNKHYWQELE